MSREPREIFDCERVRSFLESYLQDQVPPPERRAMRQHIHACPDCHARVLARDPLQIFAALADEQRPPESWAGFWEAVRADIHAVEEEKPAWWAWAARPAFAWSAAAALLLAVLALALPMPRPRPQPSAPPAAIPVAATAESWHDVLPSDGRFGEPGPPTIEEVRSPSAHVLSMKVFGHDQSVTEVVMIVDGEIKL